METSNMTAAFVRVYDEKRFLAALFSFSLRRRQPAGMAGSSANFFSTARRFVESRRQ